jgi:hypothetical protein
MRTILYSSERITANSWEAGAFIAFLLVFAVSASAYVLQHGLAVRAHVIWKCNRHTSVGIVCQVNDDCVCWAVLTPNTQNPCRAPQ